MILVPEIVICQKHDIKKNLDNLVNINIIKLAYIHFKKNIK